MLRRRNLAVLDVERLRCLVFHTRDVKGALGLEIGELLSFDLSFDELNAFEHVTVEIQALYDFPFISGFVFVQATLDFDLQIS